MMPRRARVLSEGGRSVLLEQRLEDECCAVAWKTQQGLSTLQGFVCLVEYFTFSSVHIGKPFKM